MENTILREIREAADAATQGEWRKVGKQEGTLVGVHGPGVKICGSQVSTPPHLICDEVEVGSREAEGWTTALAALLYGPPKPFNVGGPVTPDMGYDVEGEWKWVIRNA